VAWVDVLRDPHLRGVEDVFAELPAIVADNRMVDLLVVVIDRDGNRRSNHEQRLADALQSRDSTLGCCAIEEVEAWLLAVHKDDLPASWQTIRAECDVKERYALPFLEAAGYRGPGQGRKAAMRKLGRGGQRLQTLLRMCEELQRLAADIARVTAR
jgi:hypothetical protein